VLLLPQFDGTEAAAILHHLAGITPPEAVPPLKPTVRLLCQNAVAMAPCLPMSDVMQLLATLRHLAFSSAAVLLPLLHRLEEVSASPLVSPLSEAELVAVAEELVRVRISLPASVITLMATGGVAGSGEGSGRQQGEETEHACMHVLRRRAPYHSAAHLGYIAVEPKSTPAHVANGISEGDWAVAEVKQQWAAPLEEARSAATAATSAIPGRTRQQKALTANEERQLAIVASCHSVRLHVMQCDTCFTVAHATLHAQDKMHCKTAAG
jgi:hypothetical protein